MLSIAILGVMLRACAPNVDPQTQASLLAVESGGEPYAVSDSNTGKSYYPRSYLEAVALTERLIRDDDRRFGPNNPGLGIGVVQIQTTNFAHLGLTPELALDPCLNLRVGSDMLAAAYRKQYREIGGPPSPSHRTLALNHALQVYNSGRPYGVDAYVARVLLASRGAFVRSVVAPGVRPVAPRAAVSRRFAQSIVSLRSKPARSVRNGTLASTRTSSAFYTDATSTQFQFDRSQPANASMGDHSTAFK